MESSRGDGSRPCEQRVPGDCDISADGNWAVYETTRPSAYNIELKNTSSGSAPALVVNQNATSGERASDPSISGNGEYVAYVRDCR